jgi:hypothetical protein
MNRIAKFGQGYMCLREENLSVNNNYIFRNSSFQHIHLYKLIECLTADYRTDDISRTNSPPAELLAQ